MAQVSVVAVLAEIGAARRRGLGRGEGGFLVSGHGGAGGTPDRRRRGHSGEGSGGGIPQGVVQEGALKFGLTLC